MDEPITTSPLMENFAAHFGMEQAEAVLAAGFMHNNDVHNDPGSDIFRWAVLLCIGYECFTRFRDDHGITVPEEDLRKWVLEEAELLIHDGDCDYLGLIAGAYDTWLPPGMGVNNRNDN